MLLVVLGIGILLTILGIVLMACFEFEMTGGIASFIGVCLIIGSLVTGIFLIFDVAAAYAIPDKIVVLEEQNQKIELQIDAVIEQYMNHESETYTGMTPENAELFAVLYPQLASNETVKKQMELYISNNQLITDYKLELCMLPVNKWWLYFGK